MDDLDRIMLKLSSGRIEPTSNAKSWRSIRKSDPYAAACIYYMNGRQKFRTFCPIREFRRQRISSKGEYAL